MNMHHFGAIVLVAACKPAEEGAGIQIGSVSSITGDYATGSVLEAIHVAVDTMNDAGGVLDQQITLNSGDDHSDEGRTSEAAQSLIDQGVTAVIGSATSTGTLNMAAITSPAEVVVISGDATSPDLTTYADDGYLFRTIPSDAVQGALLAQRSIASGHQTAAIIHVPGSYGDGMATTFREAFESSGGQVTATVAYVEGEPDYNDVLTEALADTPDVVLLAAYVVDAAQIITDYNTSFADRGAAWLFNDSLVTTDFIDLVGAGGFSFEHEGTAPTAEGPSFPAFQALWPEAPYSIFHTNNFDAAFLIGLAMEQAGSTEGPAIRDALPLVSSGGTPFGPDAFGEAIAAIRAGEDIDYVGASGEVDFDTNGDVVGPYLIWKIEGGEIVVVEDGVLPQ